MLPDVVQEEIGEIFGRACGLAWNHMAKLGQSIDYHPYGVIPPALWQTDDEVHTKVLPRGIGHGVWLQNAEWGLAGGLCSAARVAVPDVALHIPSHARPEVFSRYQFQRLGTSGVAGSGGVVGLVKHVETEVVGGRDGMVSSDA